MPPTAFLQDFLANALATILGVVVGIPVGLHLARRTQALADRAHTQRTSIETEARKNKVLGILKGELSFNQGVIRSLRSSLASLDSRSDYDAIAHAYLVQARFKKDAWEAFSQAGETSYLDDPRLLDAFSHAYYSIGRVMALSEKLFAISYTGPHPTNPALLSALEDVLQLSLEMTEQHIAHAVSRIEGVQGA